MNTALRRISAEFPPKTWATIVRAIPDLLTILSRDGYVQFASWSIEELLGFPPEYVLGHRACEFIPPDDRRNCAQWLAHAESSGLPEVVHHLVHRDGHLLTFESKISALGDQVVIVSRNVSDRDAVDRQLADMEQVWAQIYDCLDEGVAVVDRDAVIVLANQAAGRLLGTATAHLLGRPVDDYLHPTDQANRTGTVVEFLSTRGGEPAVTARAPGGLPRVVRARVLPLALSGAYPGGSVLIMHGAEGRTGAAAQSLSAPDLLSPREVQVLRLLAGGHDVRAVSTQLGLSIHTTRNYVKSLLRKLDARTQLQAVIVALRHGLIDMP